MASCVCPTVDCGDGEPRVTWPDPDCPTHGRGSAWRADDPLQKYARRHGEILESPRETEARLFAEFRGD